MEDYGFRPLPQKKFAEHVRAWLQSLDPAAVRGAASADGWEPLASSTTWVDPETGWEICVSPIPKTRHAPSDRIVGLGGAQARFKDDASDIRDALRRKYRHYGTDPELPLVIALAVNRLAVDDTDVFNVLLGDEVVLVPQGEPTAARLDRDRNGLWFDSQGPKGQRLSAVMVSRVVQPSTVVREQGKLWINPWSTRPMKFRWLNLPTYEPGGDRVRLAASQMTTAEVLGLPSDWPGPEAAFDRG